MRLKDGWTRVFPREVRDVMVEEIRTLVELHEEASRLIAVTGHKALVSPETSLSHSLVREDVLEARAITVQHN